MDEDLIWSAVLDVLRELATVEVRPSRFAPKPAVWLHGREIAHWEAPGVIDLRITARGWMSHRAEFVNDAAVHHERNRRDWIGLRPAAPDDVERLRPLLITAVDANG